MDARARIAVLLVGVGVGVGVACTVGRGDPVGLRSPREGTDARAMVAAAPSALSAPSGLAAASDAQALPVGPKGVALPEIRTIGHCDEAARARGVVRMTLAHFNDLQARYSDRVAGRSRYAYLAGYLRELVREVPETLVLDAGDDYEKGSVAELRSKGEATRQMIQALSIDARTIGNHDFAYGEDAVLRDVRLSAHPVLAANVRQMKLADDEQPFKRFVRIDVGCVRVGIVGLVTQNYGADDRPSNEPFDGVFAQDTHYAAVLEREVKEHRAEVDVMIALTHLGYFADTALAMSPAGRGVAMIVGAHTEDLFRQALPATRSDGTRTWIVQAGHFGETIGRADLVVNLKSGSIAFERYRMVDVDASLPYARDVDELAARLEGEAGARDVVGTTRAAVRQGKEMVGLVWRAASSTWSADAMLVGADLFWSGLPKGPVTLQRLYDAVLVQRQPTGTSGFSSLWIVDVSGQELASLRARLHAWAYEMHAPPRIDPARRYRLVVDKRALTYPNALFGPGVKLHEATLGGEMIDLLETYARARTAKQETID